jgi:G3E family GTPase
MLKAEHGLKIAVIENEFSDAGIDTQCWATSRCKS